MDKWNLIMNKDEKILMLENALKVITMTPHIRAYLVKNDMKALEQAEQAVYKGYDYRF